jgi:NhaA family Na+:H+ antiporter
MSIFIANLAFGSASQVEEGKVGILVGSLLAGVIGFLLLRVKPMQRLKLSASVR